MLQPQQWDELCCSVGPSRGSALAWRALPMGTVYFVGLWEIPLWQGKWAEIGLAETKLMPQ